MDSEVNFIYDERQDNLFISKKRNGEKVEGSITIGNYSLDITPEGRIVGIEVTEISQYLKNLGINPNILEDIQKADFMVIPRRDGILYIFIEIKSLEVQKKIPLPPLISYPETPFISRNKI